VALQSGRFDSSEIIGKIFGRIIRKIFGKIIGRP
jgi:hypothetical protein